MELITTKYYSAEEERLQLLKGNNFEKEESPLTTATSEPRSGNFYGATIERTASSHRTNVSETDGPSFAPTPLADLFPCLSNRNITTVSNVEEKAHATPLTEATKPVLTETFQKRLERLEKVRSSSQNIAGIDHTTEEHRQVLESIVIGFYAGHSIQEETPVAFNPAKSEDQFAVLKRFLTQGKQSISSFESLQEAQNWSKMHTKITDRYLTVLQKKEEHPPQEQNLYHKFLIFLAKGVEQFLSHSTNMLSEGSSNTYQLREEDVRRLQDVDKKTELGASLLKRIEKITQAKRNAEDLHIPYISQDYLRLISIFQREIEKTFQLFDTAPNHSELYYELLDQSYKRIMKKFREYEDPSITANSAKMATYKNIGYLIDGLEEITESEDQKTATKTAKSYGLIPSPLLPSCTIM